MQDGRACSYLLIMSNASDHYSLNQTKDSHQQAECHLRTISKINTKL